MIVTTAATTSTSWAERPAKLLSIRQSTGQLPPAENDLAQVCPVLCWGQNPALDAAAGVRPGPLGWGVGTALGSSGSTGQPSKWCPVSPARRGAEGKGFCRGSCGAGPGGGTVSYPWSWKRTSSWSPSPWHLGGALKEKSGLAPDERGRAGEEDTTPRPC